MSATYNWSYKGGSVVSYNNGIGGSWTIAASADDARPSNAVYVALFGNDLTGNGSRSRPFRTIVKAVTISNQVVVGAGTYREALAAVVLNIVGDGEVIFDGTGYPVFVTAGCAYKNITIKNYTYISTQGYVLADNCTFMDIGGNFPGESDAFLNCTFIRINSTHIIMRAALTAFGNNTYVDCADIRVANTVALRFAQWNFVFYRCNIAFVSASYVSNSLFYHCNFRFNAAVTTPAVLYPGIPAGYSQLNTIAGLQAAHLAGYPSTVFNFVGCVVGDPLFNNYAIDDFTLALNSPAKNLSFKGTYVGSRSIAQSVKASATESTGAFEFASAVNVTVANDSITLINTSADAQIDTKVIVNTMGRELANFPSFGFNADRNGQYLTSMADLAASTKAAGELLTIPASYLVENGAIVYNGATYTAGARLTTVAGQNTFATSTGGVLREILVAPQRHTVMARFGNGGSSVIAGDTLVAGYYYYVSSGAVTYGSVVYTTGEVFKADTPTAFSGAGSVTVAFSTESYQYYEPGIKPTSNNVGDSRSGAIIRGNGDPAFVRGGFNIVEFPINAKFIQIRYFIKVNNLKP